MTLRNSPSMPLLGAKPKSVRAPKRLRTLVDLEMAGLIEAAADEGLQAVSSDYDIAISDHVAGLIASPDDPVGRQYIPSARELEVLPEELDDPIGDQARSPVKGIVHRYPDRVLLKITNICAVYCRYCFRREMIGAGSEGLAEAELEAAIAYIRAHPQIWEVILTGGDPLVLSPRRLQNLFDQLGAIEHVKIIRIHSRVPIASPDSISETVLSVLKNARQSIYLVLHANHPQEISDSVIKIVGKMREAGVSLLSQSVLLKGVNDDAYTLESLFRALVLLHIKPYYLHHPDLAKGTSHFRVSLKRGREIMRQLQGRVSGLCLPTYVLDIPGGHGKIPLTHGYLTEEGDGVYTLEDYKGAFHAYEDKA